jgi:Flp pilus assembly pilin Flp
MIRLAITLLQLALLRARMLRAEESARDRGASALEWAIIAAIVVVAASIVGGVVYNVVQTKSTQLNDCANQPVGSACSP